MNASTLLHCLALSLLASSSASALDLRECNFGMQTGGDEGCSVDATPVNENLVPVAPPDPEDDYVEMALNPERNWQTIDFVVDASRLFLDGRNDWFRMHEFILHSRELNLDYTVALEFTRAGAGGETRVRVVREIGGPGLQYAPPLLNPLPPTYGCMRIYGYWQGSGKKNDNGHLWLGALPVSCDVKPIEVPIVPVIDASVPGQPVKLRIGSLGYSGGNPLHPTGKGRINTYKPGLYSNPQTLIDPLPN